MLPETHTTGEVQLSLPVHKLQCQHPGWKPIVLVACGSYNPPTIMHMRMFDLAIDRLAESNMEVWGGYLSPVHDAYKKPGLAPGAQRQALCEASVEDHPSLMCDLWELNQDGYTCTLAVLRRFQAELNKWWEGGGRPKHTQSASEPWALDGITAAHEAHRQQSQQPDQLPQVMFLCGEDVLLSMAKEGVWHQPEVLLEEFPIVCVERHTQGGVLLNNSNNINNSNNQVSEIQQVLDRTDTILGRWRHHIHLARDVAQSNISSTLVRKLLEEGRSIRYLVPSGVLNYLEKNSELYQYTDR